MIAAMELKMAERKRSAKRTPQESKRANPQKNGGRKMAHELRYGSRTVESLKEDVSVLRKLVDDMSGALEAAAVNGLKELHLDGVTKGDRAIALLKAFVPHVKYAVEREGYRNL
jgi:predicted RNase H-like nuclease (RuvC/YqgF family)